MFGGKETGCKAVLFKITVPKSRSGYNLKELPQYTKVIKNVSICFSCFWSIKVTGVFLCFYFIHCALCQVLYKSPIMIV